jgi:hypothetical protein
VPIINFTKSDRILRKTSSKTLNWKENNAMSRKKVPKGPAIYLLFRLMISLYKSDNQTMVILYSSDIRRYLSGLFVESGVASYGFIFNSK